jgi:hypothetical protein
MPCKGSKKRRLRSKSAPQFAAPEQINVQTCIDKWAEDTPEVSIAYGLFCDLVHPNIGSAFLIASEAGGQLFFSRSKGTLVATRIFEQSFPILVSLTMKQFSDSLVRLMATIWQEDELTLIAGGLQMG